MAASRACRQAAALQRAQTSTRAQCRLITPQPVVPLASVLIGALDECALYVARDDDPAVARQQVTAILQQLLDGLTPRACQRR